MDITKLKDTDIVYIVGDDGEPISVSVGEVLHNQSYYNKSWCVYPTYSECKRATEYKKRKDCINYLLNHFSDYDFIEKHTRKELVEILKIIEPHQLKCSDTPFVSMCKTRMYRHILCYLQIHHGVLVGGYVHNIAYCDGYDKGFKKGHIEALNDVYETVLDWSKVNDIVSCDTILDLVSARYGDKSKSTRKLIYGNKYIKNTEIISDIKSLDSSSLDTTILDFLSSRESDYCIDGKIFDDWYTSTFWKIED